AVAGEAAPSHPPKGNGSRGRSNGGLDKKSEGKGDATGGGNC
ncbi:hypothetical protein V3C99_015218, partial [Haemonchus contortus]